MEISSRAIGLFAGFEVVETTLLVGKTPLQIALTVRPYIYIYICPYVRCGGSKLLLSVYRSLEHLFYLFVLFPNFIFLHLYIYEYVYENSI